MSKDKENKLDYFLRLKLSQGWSPSAKTNNILEKEDNGKLYRYKIQDIVIRLEVKTAVGWSRIRSLNIKDIIIKEIA